MVYEWYDNQFYKKALEAYRREIIYKKLYGGINGQGIVSKSFCNYAENQII